ncbi:zf-HC2 domain-containing protein [Bacillus fonticola]|uniref:zf-HC2 domain-containing protein n=1 Tax=Bacillus fonticola TaxID=2728853 RepID=UPI001473FE31|nr:hypothetical protein [Bacillus fonticola]
MMANKDAHHILVRELIPFYDDVEEDAKKIIEEHVQSCRSCREYLQVSMDAFPHTLVPENRAQDEKAPPFKRLVQFKRFLFFFQSALRLFILGLVYFNINTDFNIRVHVDANMILFYFPYAALTNAIVFIFYRKLWFWIVLTFDIIVLLFFGDFVQLF